MTSRSGWLGSVKVLPRDLQPKLMAGETVLLDSAGLHLPAVSCLTPCCKERACPGAAQHCSAPSSAPGAPLQQWLLTCHLQGGPGSTCQRDGASLPQ